MRSKIKTILAFAVIVIVTVTAFVLDKADQTTDVAPTGNTMIHLYGEAHGVKRYYEIELNEWERYYKEGYRNLFLELPYSSAEFLNEWMQVDSDELLDLFFEEIQGTQSGNEHYYEFFRAIKERCPETVFWGTDVAHQYDTTGQRYLKFLEEKGLADSEQYLLAAQNNRQGEEFHTKDGDSNGISDIREAYMISNFIDAYSKCGGKIMGIYGSYHTNLYVPGRMGYELREYYGDVISSSTVGNIAFSQMGRPYEFGFCITGLIFLLMLFVPNIIWSQKGISEAYTEIAKNENKILLLLERTGEALTSTVLLIFTALNPKVMLHNGLYFEWKILIWIMAFVLMVLYECYWIRYFKSGKTLEIFYGSFCGFPVPGALLPVLAVFLLGIYSGNLIVVASSIILGIGHIGIHVGHMREVNR